MGDLGGKKKEGGWGKNGCVVEVGLKRRMECCEEDVRLRISVREGFVGVVLFWGCVCCWGMLCDWL